MGIQDARSHNRASAACSGPARRQNAVGCTLIQAVLGALLGWANHPPVLAAAVDCLRGVLRTLTSGEALHEEARPSPPSWHGAAYPKADHVSELNKA